MLLSRAKGFDDNAVATVLRQHRHECVAELASVSGCASRMCRGVNPDQCEVAREIVHLRTTGGMRRYTTSTHGRVHPVTHKDILTLHTCYHTHKHAVHSHSTPHSRMQTSECERESESVWGYTHVHGVVRSPDAHGGAATRVRTCALPCTHTHRHTHAQQR